MEMRDVIILLQEKIRMKTNEISRMEREIDIAKSVLANDIRSLADIVNNYFPRIEVGRIERE